MSVSEMTYMSYFFTIIAALFGIAAVAMFFAYDIKRCWQIVSGKRIGASSVKTSVNRQKKRVEIPVRHDRTQKLTPEEKTEQLYSNACESTVLLTEEETEPLETMCLVQDITMMDAQ